MKEVGVLEREATAAGRKVCRKTRRGSVEAARGCQRSARHRHFHVRPESLRECELKKLLVALGSQSLIESHVRDLGGLTMVRVALDI
jgi:hypothetical protein